MATTEQRSGFRLPWASDARPGTSDEDQTPPAADATPDPEGATTTPTAAEAPEMQDTTLPDPRLMAWPEADGSSGRGSSAADGSVNDPWATSDAAAEPDEDAPLATAPAPTAATAPTAPAKPRRDNLLVTGLVRAMRDAAASAREETAARFAEEAKARVEAIQADSAEEATELRKQADAEIVEIREWSKAEMARIREETDERVAGRKRRLEADVDGHAARVEHRIEGVQAAVDEFERRMSTFFEALMAEEDPARLAGLAEQLPEPPSLDLADLDVPGPSAYASFPVETLDSRGAAAAEAEAFAGIDVSAEGDDDTTSTDDDGPADAIADEDVARRLEAFSVQAASTAEAVTTELAVVGLVSVASIAGFKRALAKSHGVRTVSVASGPNGDFVFTVSHDPEADLRSTVPSLDGFQAVITNDADGVLSITATDPESAH
jgi:hypothetical protein